MDARRILKPVRFLHQTDNDGLNPTTCWNWTGARNSNGYGRFVDGGRHKLAHRVSYELFVGTIPSGLNVCHSCDNRLCVNPHHLWVGTQSENLRDAFQKARHSFPDTRGENNGNRKLSARDVQEIRAMFQGGQRRFQIAARFGVSPSTIGDIIAGKTWRKAA